MANRLKEKYTNEVIPALTEQFNYSSVMAVPKVDKIVINMGVGEAVNNAKTLEKAAAELALISGQKPSTENPQGAIVEKEAPIHASNVQVLDKNGVAGRVGYKVVDGKKVRYNKKSGEVLD